MIRYRRLVTFVIANYLFYIIICLLHKNGMFDAEGAFQLFEFVAAPLWNIYFLGFHLLMFINRGPNNFLVLINLWVFCATISYGAVTYSLYLITERWHW